MMFTNLNYFYTSLRKKKVKRKWNPSNFHERIDNVEKYINMDNKFEIYKRLSKVTQF